jgi:aryl-alcohol dehydrogenase-like predicted oxidoreductase
VRHVAVSNYTAERIREWVDIARDLGVATPVAVQPHYNLVHRNDVEDTIIPVAEELGLGVVPYYSLASGFLTGKYRSTDIDGQSSPRAQGAAKYATEAGLRILDTLEEIGDGHGSSITATSLAWLRAQPTVVAPIASARTVEQVPDLLAGARLELSADEVDRLNSVSEWTPARS